MNEEKVDNDRIIKGLLHISDELKDAQKVLRIQSL